MALKLYFTILVFFIVTTNLLSNELNYPVWLEKFKIRAYKVASTDNTNIPLLRYIAKKGKPMFISTAMTNIREVQDAVKCVKKYIPTKFVLLQCT